MARMKPSVGAELVAARRTYSLLSLSPDLLGRIFDELSDSPGELTCGSESRVQALSRTCRMLCTFYKTSYVRSAVFFGARNFRHIWDVLRWAPSVEHVSVARVDESSVWGRGHFPGVRRLTLVHVRFSGELTTGLAFANIFEAFPCLEELQVRRCQCPPASFFAGSLLKLAPRLRVLDWTEIGSCPHAESEHAGSELSNAAEYKKKSTIAFAECLSHFTNLTVLHTGRSLHNQYGCLRHLQGLRKISMPYSSLITRNLEPFLPHLKELKVLDVSENMGIGPSVLNMIPPSVVELDISVTSVFVGSRQAARPKDKETARMLGRLPHLSVLRAQYSTDLLDWRPLAPCSSIEELDLRWSNISDRAVYHGLLNMSGTLKNLNVSHCREISDVSLAAISRLPFLRVLGVSCTSVSADGLASLGNGPCRLSLRILDALGCEQIQYFQKGPLRESIRASCMQLEKLRI